MAAGEPMLPLQDFHREWLKASNAILAPGAARPLAMCVQSNEITGALFVLAAAVLTGKTLRGAQAYA